MSVDMCSLHQLTFAKRINEKLEIWNVTQAEPAQMPM